MKPNVGVKTSLLCLAAYWVATTAKAQLPPTINEQACQGYATQAGLNLRGLSAAAIGQKFVCCLAVDTAEDATKAAAVWKKLK